MSLPEKLLLMLSRNPESEDYGDAESAEHERNPLSLLCEVFPDFLRRVQGKTILDFGCGAGLQSIALLRNGATFVLGFDTNERTLSKAKENAAKAGITSGLAFTSRLTPDWYRRFDLLISLNSMEHFLCPAEVINDMKLALKAKGRLLITFGPPWFSPYGSHMQFFTKVPWLNLLFREGTVLKVRSRFRHDGASRYEQVESGLGRMTVKKFEQVIYSSGLRVRYLEYRCVKRLDWLGRLPVLRELFINHITCELALE